MPKNVPCVTCNNILLLSIALIILSNQKQCAEVNYLESTKHQTEDIKCDVHIKYVSSKLNRSYYIMQSLKGETSVNMYHKMYHTMYFTDFHSHLRYGILFWGGDGDSKKFLTYKRKL
jgi:hypothetical protein